MNLIDLGRELGALAPHVVAVALCAARLLPIAMLCPLFGGQSAPMTVRLALVLALGMAAHFGGGVSAPDDVRDVFSLGALVGKELLFGMVVGMVASLPFDAARIGGRFVDLFRGSSAEAALPSAGTRESATGDGLYQLLVGLAVTGAAFPLVLGALWKGFALVKLGAAVASEDAVFQVSGLAGTALATGLAIGAPIAGVSLAVDSLLGFISRAAAGMNLQDVAAPLRILGGGAVLWVAVGLMSDRLLLGVLRSQWALAELFGGAR